MIRPSHLTNPYSTKKAESAQAPTNSTKTSLPNRQIQAYQGPFKNSSASILPQLPSSVAQGSTSSASAVESCPHWLHPRLEEIYLKFKNLSLMDNTQHNPAINGIEQIACNALKDPIITYSVLTHIDQYPLMYTINTDKYHPDSSHNFSDIHDNKPYYSQAECYKAVRELALRDSSDSRGPYADAKFMIYESNAQYNRGIGIGHYRRIDNEGNFLDNTAAANRNLCFWAALFHNMYAPGQASGQPDNKNLMHKRSSILDHYFKELSERLSINPEERTPIEHDMELFFRDIHAFAWQSKRNTASKALPQNLEFYFHDLHPQLKFHYGDLREKLLMGNQEVSQGIEKLVCQYIQTPIVTYQCMDIIDQEDTEPYTMKIIRYEPNAIHGTTEEVIDEVAFDTEEERLHYIKMSQSSLTHAHDTTKFLVYTDTADENHQAMGIGSYQRLGQNGVLLNNVDAMTNNLSFWGALFHNMSRPGQQAQQIKNDQLKEASITILQQYFMDLNKRVSSKDRETVNRMIQAEFYGENSSLKLLIQ